MTMTLEQIKGMNIPVGTPIEVELKYNDETRKDVGYFQGFTGYRTPSGGRFIEEIILVSQLKNTAKREDFAGHTREITDIQDIKILEYKKSITNNIQ